MKNLIKKIYTILVLTKNIIFKKEKYTLHFIAENNPPIKRWYYDFKHWGFAHGNLEMVSGADSLCELYAQGNDEVTVNIIATNKLINDKQILEQYDLFIAEELPQNTKLIDKYAYGRQYNNTKTVIKNLKEQIQIRTMWICPVTLFVLGRYPKYIYIKTKNK